MFFKIINKVKSKVKFLRNLESFSLISVFNIIGWLIVFFGWGIWFCGLIECDIVL